MISKTHISGQKPRGRQLNKKVCGSKSAIFVILSFFLSFFLCFFVQTTLSNNDNSKTVQALTLILARNGCSSQRAASQPLSVFIASNSPWSIKAIIIRLTHANVWESIGKPSSCTQFIKSRIFYSKSRENPYQYCNSRANPYQVL